MSAKSETPLVGTICCAGYGIHGEHCPRVLLYAAKRSLAASEAECLRLRAGYAEAIEDIESWGAYAHEYFQKKHDLEGCLAKHRAALSGGEG